MLQVLEQERQQLRAAAMDIAEFRAQQQAIVLEEQQKCQALQHQLQKGQDHEQQQQKELVQLKEQVATLQQLQQHQETEQEQLSAALKMALDQKQVWVRRLLVVPAQRLTGFSSGALTMVMCSTVEHLHCCSLHLQQPLISWMHPQAITPGLRI